MSDLEIFTHDGALVVASDTIASGAGVEHRAVLQLIGNNIADFEEFGQVAFEMRAGYNNARVRVALLNEQQATLLMTYQRNTEQVRTFKKALVKAFFEMAHRIAVPQSLPEALRAYALEVEHREALEAKIAQDAPKIAYVEMFVACEDLRLLRNVAKSIGVQESALRDALISHRWMYAEHIERWSATKRAKEIVTRYSAYADKRDYFRPVPNHDAPRFKGEVMHTLKITPQGAAAIARAAAAWGLAAKDAA
ncbi:Rha family transcriptional regulator [Gryllotalpicola koreensis]|uniref:Phage antirepressor KilAC domain-containing protein n=1 Tax=Gryllotalpicola koreensis TaxID=993086 RepID=A0ABP8A2M5_9MICO